MVAAVVEEAAEAAQAGRLRQQAVVVVDAVAQLPRRVLPFLRFRALTVLRPLLRVAVAQQVDAVAVDAVVLRQRPGLLRVAALVAAVEQLLRVQRSS